MAASISLRAVFRIAVYYGFAGFGGGYSVLAQLRRDLVSRRKWLTEEDFLVLAELSKSLPGTPATNLLALLGQRVAGAAGGALAASATALIGLLRVFVPIGVLTFGGGLAMIPAIDHMVVIEQGWLDLTTFADAIALGQITPGPVAICATFIGYRVAGVLGALVATIAIFAPATAVALAAGHSIARFRASPLIEGALRLLAPAVIVMLGAATFSLARSTVSQPMDVALAVAAFGALVWRPIGPLWLLFGGGALRLGVLWMRHT